jgi:transposase
MHCIQGEARSHGSLFSVAPDFKTIADFRKGNGKVVQASCRAFVQFCRQVGLIGGQLVVIAGGKFQAAASARQHLNLKRLKWESDLCGKPARLRQLPA